MNARALRPFLECVIVFALVYSLVVAAACAAPEVLGGPTADNTSRVCADGTRCPNWLACPNLASPGRCEESSGPAPMQWGARHPADADGCDAAP